MMIYHSCEYEISRSGSVLESMIFIRVPV